MGSSNPGTHRRRLFCIAFTATTSVVAVTCISTQLTAISMTSIALCQNEPERADVAFDVPAPIEKFTGAWHGIYYKYPTMMGLKLNVKAAGGNAFVGTVDFYRLVKVRTVVGSNDGQYAVRGTYDPQTRTFRLMQTRWIQKPRGLIPPSIFQGVLNPKGSAIAGLRGDLRNRRGIAQAYYVLTRPENAESLIGPMEKSIEIVSIGRRSPGGPDEDTLIRWGQKFRDEYPDIDPYRTELGALYARAYNLFEDEHFEKHFGKRFDQMSPTDRRAVSRRIGGTRNQHLRQYSGLSRAFNGMRTQGTPEVMHAVLAQRAFRQWRRDMLTYLETLPAELRSFDRINAVEAAGEIHLRTLWPSEQTTFKQASNAARQRLAGPLIVRIADQSIREASGYGGARALAGWKLRHKRVLKWVEPSTREKTIHRIHTKLDELLAPLIAAEVRRLYPLDEGVNGLLIGNDWYREFRRKYQFANRHPAYRPAIEKLRDVRDRQIASVADDIIAVIAKMGVESEVNELMGRLLAIPGDRTTPSGRTIMASAGRQIQQIRELRRRKTTGQFLTLLALFAELAKRSAEDEKDHGGVVIASVLRGHLIEAAIGNFDPKMTEKDVIAMRMVITLGLDGELFDKKAVDQEINREKMLAEIRRRYPGHNFEEEAANIAWEVFKQFRK